MEKADFEYLTADCSLWLSFFALQNMKYPYAHTTEWFLIYKCIQSMLQ